MATVSGANDELVAPFIIFYCLRSKESSSCSARTSPQKAPSTKVAEARNKALTSTVGGLDLHLQRCAELAFTSTASNGFFVSSLEVLNRDGRGVIACIGDVDGLIDFDALLNDAANPSHMLPQYLTDGIHPNDAGHQAMADFIDLRLLTDDQGRASSAADFDGEPVTNGHNEPLSCHHQGR